MKAVLDDVEKFAETLAEARTRVEAVMINQLLNRELCRFGICQATIAEGAPEDEMRAQSAKLATQIGAYKKVAKHAKKLKTASAKPKAKAKAEAAAPDRT